MILVPNDGSHRYHRDNVDICGVGSNEEQEDVKNQREQGHDEDNEVEIGDQGVSIDWGPESPPVVTNVYELEPEDVNVPAFDDDDYSNDNDQDDCDEDENIPASFYQSYNGSFQYDNGNDDEGEGDDSSAMQEHDDESIGFFSNSISPQDDDNHDSFGISPIPTPKNPTIRRRRKKLPVNPKYPNPKVKKRVINETIMKKIKNVINPFRVPNEATDSKG